MSEKPRTVWQWTPRSTALAMTGALVTAAWVAVGATMMLADNPASSTAAPVKATPSIAASTRASAPARPAVKPNRSHSRYNPKPYKGPLSKMVLKAPVAIAHPPQGPSKPPSADAPAEGAAAEPDRGSDSDHRGDGGGHRHGH